MKSQQHRIEMTQRRARRNVPNRLIPLFDQYNCQPDPKLIGWYDLSTGVILTANFNPSLGGTKAKPNRSHDGRVLALNDRVKLAVEEVSASVDAEAPAES